ncbi:alpha/beta hydrolase [Sphingobium sufflavum]|uniref:alpha/beta hydrolase n=1 Tax=Sphingobium sufflavum TaxID=1129547 RepID=UPI001F40D629|nr:alpha/beta hydrolase [Sphingobium sufflavum]MCE7798269.1 alpha/beta hydrolase [Sphingobium sufflavum]
MVDLRSRLAVMALVAASAVTAGQAVKAEEISQRAPAGTDAGAIDIPAFAYPPSALASEELKRAYARSLSGPGNGTITPPKDPKLVAIMRSVVNGMFEKSLPFLRERYPVETAQETIAGVEVIRVRPKGGVSNRNSKRVLIEVHGGSFMVGWPSVALLDAIPVASLSGIEVISINYRLYPEAMHPAALEDLTAVYREVLKTHAPRNVGIFGGSAGGVITLQSIPWFKKQGVPLPAAIAPLSCAFQTATGDSAIWNFSGGFARPGTTLVAKGGYFGDNYDRRDIVPEVTPERLADYPPTLWLSGTRAPEMSGAAVGHASLLRRGIRSELYIIEGGWHQSYSTAPETPESQDAMRYIARWFDTHLGR